MELSFNAARIPSVFSIELAQEDAAPVEAPGRSFRTPLMVMAIVVVVWGIAPPITKLVSAPPLIGTFIRFAISAPILLLVLALRRRPLRRRIFLATALPGLSFGINLIFVFATLQEATVSVLSTISAMQPALVLLMAGRLFGERPSSRQLGFTMMGVCGAVGVVLGAGSELRTSWWGIGFALLSLMTFTSYFVLTRLARADGEVDAIEWMAGINIWAFLSTIPPVLILADGSDWSQFGGTDWLWISVIAVVTGLFGHVLMTWVHGHIEVARSSLYILTMHLVAVGLAWLIHGETITWVQALAGVVVLSSVGFVIISPTRHAAR